MKPLASKVTLFSTNYRLYLKNKIRM